MKKTTSDAIAALHRLRREIVAQPALKEAAVVDDGRKSSKRDKKEPLLIRRSVNRSKTRNVVRCCRELCDVLNEDCRRKNSPTYLTLTLFLTFPGTTLFFVQAS